MNRDRLETVVTAARQLVAVWEQNGLGSEVIFAEKLAELELSLAELVAPTCAGCGLPILGREELRTGRSEAGWVHYHRTCCRDYGVTRDPDPRYAER